MDKALASHSWGQGSNPAETRGKKAWGLTSPVIQVYGRPTLYGGASA